MNFTKQEMIEAIGAVYESRRVSNDAQIENIRKNIVKGLITEDDVKHIVNKIYPSVTDEEGNEINEFKLVTKEMVISAIKAYRYEKQLYFEYDNCTQRFDSYDIQRMNDMAEALSTGILTEIEWEYPLDNTSKIINESQYFLDMKIAGYTNEQKVRSIEKQLIQSINNITIENYKEEFDKLM